MANDHRIESANGETISYTCENRRYKTNTEKGHPHGSKGEAKGNVLPGPLFDGGSYSLWLEHVVEKKTEKEVFWLMWYRDGVPTIPASGVLNAKNLDTIISNLAGVRREALNENAV
jgi:hypothetical protein